MRQPAPEEAIQPDDGHPRLLLVVDGTASMGSFLHAVRETVGQLVVMADMVLPMRAGVLVYRDYSDPAPRLLQWSGYMSPLRLISWCKDNRLVPEGGGDTPEASKTAFSKVLELAGSDTLVFHFSDAPPHHAKINGDNGYPNGERERQALECSDWVQLCAKIRARGIPMVSVCANADQFARFYLFAGPVVALCEGATSCDITRVAVSLLAAALGMSAIDTDDEFWQQRARFMAFEVPPNMELSETDPPTLRHLGFTAKGKVAPVHFVAHPAVPALPDAEERFNVAALRASFFEDAGLRERVMNGLETLLQTNAGVMALTYNAVFGTMWRLVCACVKDSKRAEALANMMGTAIARLPVGDREAAQAWLEESFNRGAEIQETVAACRAEQHEGAAFPVLVLDARDMLKRRELNNIMRGLGTHAETRGLMRMLANMTVIDAREAEALPVDMPCLPLALPDKDLFRMLPHLIAPGLIAGSRAAALLAALALQSRSAHLADRALRNLRARRGSWIVLDEPETHPENYTAEFARLMVEADDIARGKDGSGEPVLTEEERKLLAHLHRISRFRLSLNAHFELQLPFRVPSRAREMPDLAFKCDWCGRFRSFTLMRTATQCGPCAMSKEDSAAVPGQTVDPKDGLTSTAHYFPCRTCAALYVVRNVDDLKVSPKCHFCRTKQPVPVSTCSLCHNSYVDEAQLCAGPEFVCPCCAGAGKKAVLRESNVSLKALCELLPALPGLAGLHTAPELFERMSLFKSLPKIPEIPKLTPEDVLKSREGPLRYKKLHVHNALETLRGVAQQVSRGGVTDTCPLCCETKLLGNLTAACGNCENRLCDTCLGAWYGECRPGRVVLEASLRCPFCKQAPTFAVLRPHNRVLAAVARRVPAFDPKCYHAWCLDCRSVAVHSDRACAGQLPDVTDFRCEACIASLTTPSALRKIKIAMCPGCSVMTEKIDGCDHITCSACMTHWCWGCRYKGACDDDVYRHMYSGECKSDE